MFMRDHVAITTVALRAMHARQKGDTLHMSYDKTVMIIAQVQYKFLFLTATHYHSPDTPHIHFPR